MGRRLDTPAQYIYAYRYFHHGYGRVTPERPLMLKWLRKPAEQSSLIAHELFHNFQSDMIYTDDAIPAQSPWWLVEGSAEYASIRYLTDRYGIDWNFYVSIYELGLDRDLPPLGMGAGGS